MKAKFHPTEDFAEQCREAAFHWREKEAEAVDKIRRAYQSKTKRCGFLWLKRRPVTAREAEKMLRASTSWLSGYYDHAWDDVERYRYWANTANRILALVRTAPEELYLSEHETSVIFALED